MEDGDFNFLKARRRSNSSVDAKVAFKSKFETSEEDPVFEESKHGDQGYDHYTVAGSAEEGDSSELDRQSSADSSIDSVEMESPVEVEAQRKM